MTSNQLQLKIPKVMPRRKKENRGFEQDRIARQNFRWEHSWGYPLGLDAPLAVTLKDRFLP